MANRLTKKSPGFLRPINWLLAILLAILLLAPLNCVNANQVVKVIDGDTIELANGERVRYIGIDTPEREPLDVIRDVGYFPGYYSKAKDFNADLVLGKVVRLEGDEAAGDKDRYGRLLRYVFVDDLLVEEEIVRQGYAVVFKKYVNPDYKYYERLVKAEEEAQENKRGIWGIKQ